MLTSATMRFCTDIFGVVDESIATEPDDTTEPSGETDEGDGVDSDSGVTSAFYRYALLVSKTAWNCTDKLAVTGFDLYYVAPNKTHLRVLFKIGDKYYKFVDNALEEVTLTELTAKNVILNGNSMHQLLAVTDAPGFVGKKIYPIIALRALDSVTDMPAVKIGLKVLSSANVLVSEQESLVYEMTDDLNIPRIIDISPNTTCTGNGEVDIKVRLRDADGKWSSYSDLSSAADQEAAAVQFKFIYKVSTPAGSDSARVNFISVAHTFGKMIVSGENADIYTTIQRYDIPLQMCYVIVRHAPLNDSKIEAYVNFMHEVKHRELIQIGTGTGALQTLVLGVNGVADNNIDTSTLQLFADGKSIGNFSYNSETSTVTFTTKKNNVVYASYDYDHDVEDWRKMTLDVTEPYNHETGDCASRFVYSLTDDEAAGKVISNVRLKLIRPTGKVKNTDLGKGAGKSKMFVLPHIPKASTIKFSDESVEWSYNEDNNTLIATAAKTVSMIISYTWQGESIKLYSLAAGWSVA